MDTVSTVIAFGESAAEISAAWTGSVPIYTVSDLPQALNKARTHVERGGIILFSPACTSFDQFTSYAERGKRFKELVRERQTVV